MVRPTQSWSDHVRFGQVEIGLLPDVFWDMTIQEFNYQIEALEYKRAYNLEGHRLVASQVYNMLSEKPLLPWQYLPLVIDDKIIVATTSVVETDEDFVARMRDMYLKPTVEE